MKKKYLIGFCFYLFSSAIMACSCYFSSLAEKINISENIFIVETYQIETLKQANPEEFFSGERRGHFKVLKTLKGSSSGMTFINSAEKPICCMCQSQVKNNTKYLVFNSGGSEIHYGSCSLTKPVTNTHEITEIIEGMLEIHKPTSIFTGIYISKNQLFLNDNGNQTKALQLKSKNYFAKMIRVSFEGLKLPSGKVMVTNLQEEQVLSDDEVDVIEERLAHNKTLDVHQ